MLAIVVPPFTLCLPIMAVAVLVPMGSIPMGVPMGGTTPVSSHPGVVPGGAIPIAADPDEIDTGAGPDNHFLARRGRGALEIEVD